jgi:hypothetical protein
LQQTLKNKGNGSVWESNPLRAFVKPPTGFEDQSSPTVTTSHENTSEEPPIDWARCWALLREKSPDLALIVEQWESLSEPVRAGILAMVKASKGS